VKCFTHLHALDIYFHKISSKNTVFAINKALRSIESALRFTLGFFTPVAFEFVLLCGMLQFYCGAPYLLNMLVTLSLYTVFSKQYSAYRQQIIRKRKNQEKASEFYLNESIMNYETVKAFNKERFELSRYQALLQKLKGTAMQVQTTLSKLNVGQSLIFSTGLTINLILAAWDVSNGRLTPGDFVMIQALFMQLAGPLFNMGTLFREIDQSQVDVEDLFFMLKQQPVIKEKEGAVAYDFRGGEIELRNVSFKHLLTDAKNGDKETGRKNDYMFENLSLKIKPGTSNAIVGHSGFGKTTMINMITRLYDPSAG
jgi:ABC-type transport system involved in Fe-S cluster assembly fused permease/ATPase subunit